MRYPTYTFVTDKSVPNTQAMLEAKNTPFKDSHTFTGTPSHGRYTYRAVNAIHGAKSPTPIMPESEASFVPYSSRKFFQQFCKFVCSHVFYAVAQAQG